MMNTERMYICTLTECVKFVNSVSSVKDKLNTLEYFIEVFKKDLISSMLTAEFYPFFSMLNTDTKESLSTPCLFFPQNYYTDKMENIRYFAMGKEVSIDILGKDILSYPVSRKNIAEYIAYFADNNVPIGHANHCIYVPYLNLCIVKADYHHRLAIKSVMQKKSLFFTATEYDITKFFDDVYTDGTHWLHKYVPDKFETYSDFRLGIIYTLSHIKYHFETSAENAELNSYLKIRDSQIELMHEDQFENLMRKQLYKQLEKKFEVKKIMQKKNKIIFSVKK